MKKNNFIILTIFSIMLFLYACDRNVKEDLNEKYSAILECYVDNTVIPTYKGMANVAMDLLNDCNEMTFPVSQSLFNSACEKWRNARLYWEQSEAFLFGPAEYNNLDPHLDSWPLDKNRLDQVLAMPNILNMDAAYARNYLSSSLLGFHAIEYILFRDGQPRNTSNVTMAELVYLKAITHVLVEDCILLEGGWSGKEALSAEKRAILAAAGLDIAGNFGYEMQNAGKIGSRYSSVNQGIEEMIEGCKDIADEVGNSKIADPVESQNVLDVESWYSWNSIQDFVNNIMSIRNTYYGSRDGSVAKNSLSNYLSEKNPSLNNEIKARIENAKVKIVDIGEPFRNHLDNNIGAAAATKACNELSNSLNKIYNEIE